MDLRFRERRGTVGWARLGELAVGFRGFGDPVELETGKTRFVGAANDAEDEFDVVLLCEWGRDTVSAYEERRTNEKGTYRRIDE